MTEKKLSEKMREVVGDPEKNIEFIVKNDGWVEQAKELEAKLAAAEEDYLLETEVEDRLRKELDDLRAKVEKALQDIDIAGEGDVSEHEIRGLTIAYKILDKALTADPESDPSEDGDADE